MSAQHVGEAITRLFEGDLSEAESRDVYAHLRTCAECERLYERHAHAERQLYAVADGDVAPASFDRVAARLTAAPPVRRPRRFAWVAIAALAAAASVFVVVRPGAEDRMNQRGDAVALDAAFGLRVLRLRVGADERVDVADAASAPLAEGDILKFVYSTGRDARAVKVAVLDASGRPLAELGPVEVAGGAVEARLDGRLDVGAWPAGPVAIVAVFGADAATTTRRPFRATPEDDGDVRVRVVQSRVVAK